MLGAIYKLWTKGRGGGVVLCGAGESGLCFCYVKNAPTAGTQSTKIRLGNEFPRARTRQK